RAIMVRSVATDALIVICFVTVFLLRLVHIIPISIGNIPAEPLGVNRITCAVPLRVRGFECQEFPLDTVWRNGDDFDFAHFDYSLFSQVSATLPSGCS